MAENKAALLIASFEYDDPHFRPLKAPAQDVKLLSRALSDPAIGGFGDVTTLLNEPKDALVLAIEEFFDDRKPDDLLILYFSGHGIKDEDGRLYYATKNTRHKRLVATAIPAYQVNDLISKSRSRRKILVLDCCYSGAYSKTFLAKGDVGGDAAVGAMEVFKQGQGLVTLTASDAFQYSFEEDEPGNAGVCSVFTRALVDGIETGKADRDGDQLISLDELYEYAYERVHSENPHQNPRIQGEVEGKIIVARNPQPPRPAQLPSELVEAIGSSFTGNREYAVRELDKLLRGRNRAVALAAYEALSKLKDDDSRRVASAAEACLSGESRRIAPENAEAEQEAAANAEADRVARERDEQERLGRERAEQERLRQEKAEAERQALEAQRVARENVEKQRLEQEAAAKAEADRLARERDEQEGLGRERAEQERLRQEKAEAERQALEAQRVAPENVEPRGVGTEKAEPERTAHAGSIPLPGANQAQKNILKRPLVWLGLFAVFVFVLWMLPDTPTVKKTVVTSPAPAGEVEKPPPTAAVPTKSHPPDPGVVEVPSGEADVRKRWIDGPLYGGDNSMAARRSVTIVESEGGYRIHVSNQFGFTCALEFDKSGKPSSMADCSGGTGGWSIKETSIRLRCLTNGKEAVCNGNYSLCDGISCDPATMTIARKLVR